MNIKHRIYICDVFIFQFERVFYEWRLRGGHMTRFPPSQPLKYGNVRRRPTHLARNIIIILCPFAAKERENAQ